MIFFVDDDPAMVALVGRILDASGHLVEVFPSAREALSRCAQVEPELVISDVRMPEMDGYAFHAAYREAFPLRETPFLFLSSLVETPDILRGYEEGAVDYLTKPVSGPLLAAKVKSVLDFKHRLSVSRFSGKLSDFPFAKIVQYCEMNGLTGDVEFEAPGLHVSLPFRSGIPDPSGVDETDHDALVAQLFDLREGNFTIHSRRVEFRNSSAASDSVDPAWPEVVVRATPTPHVKPASQAATPVPPAVPSPPPKKASADLNARFMALFEEGLQAHLSGDKNRALILWEQAQSLNPEHKGLKANLEILRKKMGGSKP